MATALVIPAEVEKSISAVVEQAKRITVDCADGYEMAAEFLQLVARRKKSFLDWFEPHVKRAHATWKEMVRDRDSRVEVADQARQIVERKMLDWRAAEERKRREEEARLAEAAKREADERALAEAAALEAAGEKELAAIVIEDAAVAPPPVVVLESSVPKQEGIASRKTWHYRIVDESKIPREYLMVNEKAIGAVVRAQKGMTRIPGVQTYSEDAITVRTASHV